MADAYFETDNITKEYDSRLVSRILSYLKPYRFLACFTIVFLFISTFGELFIPVLQQRIIDGAILARFLAFDAGDYEARKNDLSEEARQAFNELASLSGTLRAGNMIFVKLNQRVVIKGKAEDELKNKGMLQEEQWYAFSYNPADAEDTFRLRRRAVIEKRPGLFLIGPDAAIRKDDLYALPYEEILAVRGRDVSVLTKGGILFFAVLALIFLLTFLQTWTANLMTQRVMKDMRIGLFKKTLSQSTAFLSRHPVGRIVTRLTGDVQTMDEFFTTVLVAFLKDASVMAGTLATLFVLSPRMALVVLVMLPPVAALTLASRVRARDAFRLQRTASSAVYAFLAERLAGMQVVQLFRQEKKSARDFNEGNQKLLSANLGEMYVFATFRPAIEWFSTFTAAVVIVVGSKMVLSLSLSLGVLIAFISLVQMFFSPVMDIAEKYTMLQSAMAGGEKVFNLLDADEQIPDKGDKSPGGLVRGHVEFDNVRFSYKTGEEVLKGLSFSVKPGEMAAIVGFTGAGKTTIINVLARLWDVDSGEIRLDGVPVKDIPLDELRRSALSVMQDVTLFSGTVEENISLGLGITREQVIEAAKTVYAHDFILGLPEGYDTALSEGASNISAGERQLISFARVIAHNPRVVILDEATSSIDSETERLIQLGMKKALAGRTSFVIAHRLSTIPNASRIFVLSAGRLVEEGTHKELVARNGFYAGLYRLQYDFNA
jgi:ATP-binding cassette subfamily B protein